MPPHHHRALLRRRIPIIYTRHRQLSLSDESMLAERSGNDLILEGAPGAALLPSIGRQEGDFVMARRSESPFIRTNLESTLKWRRINEVIITGVQTHLCCATTARSAFARGISVFFSEDATTAEDWEVHEMALKKLAAGYVYIVNCERLGCLPSSHPARAPRLFGWP